MSRESEIAQLMRDDATLSALLPGGVWTSEQVGIEGIRRGEDSPTSSAFDESGYLLTCALVVQSDLNSLGDVRSIKDRITATSQRVRVFFYEMRTHNEIDLAKQRTYEVLEGVRLSDSYQIAWDMETEPFYDMGPVSNSTVVRQDWIVYGLRRPA